MEQYSDRVDQIQSPALEALQNVAKDVVVSLFQDSILCTMHAKQVILKPIDMSLILHICSKSCLSS